MAIMKTADIIVIGGGMAGISIASKLAEQAKVMVLEAESQIGYHSTARSAAMLIRNYGSDVLRVLNHHSHELFTELESEFGRSLLSIRGELMVADVDESEQFEAYLAQTPDLERLDVDQAVRLCPALRKEKIRNAAIERGAADIDVDGLLQYYVRRLKHFSGEICVDQKVTSLLYKNQCWQIASTNSSYAAPVVVNAAGAWADLIAAQAQIKPLDLTPMRRSAALIKVAEFDNVNHWPLVLSASESWYAKPQSGLLIVSPADEEPVEPHDAWPDDTVLAEGLYRFEQFMAVQVRRIEHCWAGLRTFAKDRNPVVGFCDQAEGFFWLAGQGGYGIQTAPILAQLGSDLILSRRTEIPGEIIQALSPNRYSVPCQFRGNRGA